MTHFSQRNSTRWAQDKIDRFEGFLPARGGSSAAAAGSIIDIGCGRGFVSSLLAERGFEVTPVDVVDKTRVVSLTPVIYDGISLPFGEDTFDLALILTVLHHTPDPDTIIAEAARVAPRVVVIEDTYHARLKGWLTKVADSISNLEFRGHPHSNRTDRQWRDTFTRLGLSVRHSRTDPVFGFFSQHRYWLERM